MQRGHTNGDAEKLETQKEAQKGKEGPEETHRILEGARHLSRHHSHGGSRRLHLLTAFYREAVSDVTTTIFTACIGYFITYAGKSLGEKISRNKHRLDADWNPLPEDTTSSSDSTNIGKG